MALSDARKLELDAFAAEGLPPVAPTARAAAFADEVLASAGPSPPFGRHPELAEADRTPIRPIDTSRIEIPFPRIPRGIPEFQLRSLAEAPGRTREKVIEATEPFFPKPIPQALGSALSFPETLLTLPARLLLEQTERLKTESPVRATLETAFSGAELLTGVAAVPEIARQIREGSLLAELAEDPVRALAPVGALAGMVAGAARLATPRRIPSAAPTAETPIAAAVATERPIAPAPSPAETLVRKGIEPSTAAAMGKNIARAERRLASEARGRRILEEATDATSLEIDQVTIGQLEELSRLPQTEAASLAKTILSEQRAAPLPAPVRIPPEEFDRAEKAFQEVEVSERVSEPVEQALPRGAKADIAQIVKEIMDSDPFLPAIRGRLRFEDVSRSIGDSGAQDLLRQFPGVFRKRGLGGQPLDTLAEELQSTGLLERDVTRLPEDLLIERMQRLLGERDRLARQYEDTAWVVTPYSGFVPRRSSEPGGMTYNVSRALLGLDVPQVALGEMVARLHDAWTESLAATRPAFFDLHPKAPRFAAAAQELAASHGYAEALAHQFSLGLKRILPSLNDRVDFAVYMNDQQLQPIRLDPERAASVKLPALEAPEVSRILGRPRMQEALAYWKNQAQPVLESFAERAGVRTRRETPSGLYWKLVRAEDVSGGTLVGGVAPTGRVIPRFKMGRAMAARRATGGAELYALDPDAIILESFRDRVPVAARNEVLDAIRDWEVKPGAVAALSREAAEKTPPRVPSEVDFGGRKVPVVTVDLGRTLPLRFPEGEKVFPQNVFRPVRVPKPIADAFNHALNPPRGLTLAPLVRIQNVSTSAAIASGAEAFFHSIGVLSALGNVPGLVRFGRPVARAMAWLGPPGRIASGIANIANLYGKDFMVDWLNGVKNGAMRLRMFREETGLQRFPPFKQIQKAIFGYPGDTRGLMGLESRARVLGFRLLRMGNPRLSDAEIWSRVNNHFGTYVDALQPDLVRIMKNVPVLGDPFASAGVSLGKTAVKGLGGFGPRGFSWELLGSTAAGLALAYLLPKAFDPDHRDPWDIPGLKFGSIRIHKDDGKTVDYPAFRIIMPAIFRGFRMTGAAAVYDSVAKGQVRPGELAEAWLRGVANALLLSRIGPTGRIATALVSGKAPFLTSSNELLPVAEKSMTGQVAANIRAAGRVGLPLIGRPLEEEERGMTPDSATARAIQLGLGLFGAQAKLGPPESELGRRESRSEIGRLFSVVQDIVFQASNHKPEGRLDFIRKRIADNIPKELRARAFQLVVQGMKRRRKPLGKASEAPEAK